MTPDEEAALLALQELIETKTGAAKDRAINELAKHITVGYYLGAEKGISETGARIAAGNVGIAGLDKVIDELAPRLDSMFGGLSHELTDIISDGVTNSLSYEDISAGLRDKMTTWGDSVTFENAGKVISKVDVFPDGSMKLIQHTIKQNVTIPIGTYADTLSRTATKQAYAAGHIEGYHAAGLEKWQYSSVADERTRLRHIALHGQVYVIGSADSDMAFQVMSEYNCRCRPVGYFDDPDLDTPAEEWAKEKEEWAKQALDELPEGATSERKYLEDVIKSKPKAAKRV